VSHEEFSEAVMDMLQAVQDRRMGSKGGGESQTASGVKRVQQKLLRLLPSMFREDLASLVQVFQQHDPGETGVISLGVLEAVFTDLGVTLKPKELRALAWSHSISASSIDYFALVKGLTPGRSGSSSSSSRNPGHEHLLWYEASEEVTLLARVVRKQLQLESRWKYLAQMFQEADTDGNGAVDQREFQAMLAHLDVPLSAGDAQMLISALDRNGDGVIDHHREFVQVLTEETDSDSAERRPTRRSGALLISVSAWRN
jgi:Ca2+-binding EF-hand superfamily protein